MKSYQGNNLNHRQRKEKFKAWRTSSVELAAMKDQANLIQEA